MGSPLTLDSGGGGPCVHTLFLHLHICVAPMGTGAGDPAGGCHSPCGFKAGRRLASLIPGSERPLSTEGSPGPGPAAPGPWVITGGQWPLTAASAVGVTSLLREAVLGVTTGWKHPGCLSGAWPLQASLSLRTDPGAETQAQRPAQGSKAEMAKQGIHEVPPEGM